MLLIKIVHLRRSTDLIMVFFSNRKFFRFSIAMIRFRLKNSIRKKKGCNLIIIFIQQIYSKNLYNISLRVHFVFLRVKIKSKLITYIFSYANNLLALLECQTHQADSLTDRLTGWWRQNQLGVSKLCNIINHL